MPSRPSIRGERTGASDCPGVEVPWPLYLAQNLSPNKKPRIRRYQESEKNTGRRGEGKRDPYGPTIGKAPGDDRDLVGGQGRQSGVKPTM